MLVKDFSFDLPKELIALYPTVSRVDSRLLYLNPDANLLEDHNFNDVIDFIEPNDLVIFNDTKVIKARLYGHKESGGAVEILVERVLLDNHVLAHVRASKALKEGMIVNLDNSYQVVMVKRHDTLFELEFLGTKDVFAILDEIGHIPLPPYIERKDEDLDFDRYQTVYSKKLGAVAAPTAGLHFNQELLDKLVTKGVNLAYVTLHVGAGTFQPVRVDNIDAHKMHSEWIDVPKEIFTKIEETKAQGGRVIAVGTTSVRSLESAYKYAKTGYTGETDIFIYPGYKFKIVDAMITNFHLPESTLIMLVSAFAGQKEIMNAYQHAIDEKYRFFSYGDAMFLTKKTF